MTKVLFIVNGYPSKKDYANIFIKTQADALKNYGVDVAVLIIDIRSIRRIRRFGFYKEDTGKIPTWRVSFPWGPFFLDTGQKLADFLGCWAYNKIQMNFGKPDILHAHFGRVGITGAKIKSKYNVPLVITEHGSDLLPGNSTTQHKLNILNEAYKKGNKLIAVSVDLSKHIMSLGVKNIFVIPNIISANFLNYNNKIYGRDKKQFVSVGSLLPNKRFDLTISAFARMCEIVPDASLVIVGIGPSYKMLNKMIHDKKIEDKVLFYGFVSNTMLPKIYKESLCFVLPSEFETFGVVYIEALACGIPVIATRCGGPEDIVTDKNGLLIPKNDEDALVEAMLYMYNNSMNYNPESLADDIKNRFGEKAVVENIIAVYTELLTEQRDNIKNTLFNE